MTRSGRPSPPPPAIAAAHPGLTGALDRLTTDDALRAAAESIWNPLVGAFAGGIVRPGQVDRVEYVAPLAIVPAPIPYWLEFSGELDPDGSVRVTCLSRPSPEPLRRAIEAAVVPGLGGARLTAFETRSETVLHTDPATLIPRTASAVQRTHAESTAGTSRTVQWTEDRRAWRCAVLADA